MMRASSGGRAKPRWSSPRFCACAKAGKTHSDSTSATNALRVKFTFVFLCAFCDLKEHPHAKLNVTRRVVREQSTKVCIVYLSRTVKLQALNRPDVEGVWVPARKPFRNTRTEEIERQSANRLTWCNRQSNAVEYSINLGKRRRLSWICSVPRIDLSLRYWLITW